MRGGGVVGFDGTVGGFVGEGGHFDWIRENCGRVPFNYGTTFALE